MGSSSAADTSSLDELLRDARDSGLAVAGAAKGQEMHFGANEPGDDVDWDDPLYVADPRRAYDQLRDRCPLVRRRDGSWLVTGHEEVRRCALAPEALSNHVSSRLQIPNGLDGDEHRRFRALIDRFFEAGRVLALSPRFRALAQALSSGLGRGSPVDAVSDIGAPLAVRFQCEWLGWPSSLEPVLLAWMADYRAAQRGSDPSPRARAAERFDSLVEEQLRIRQGTQASDVTSELLHSTVEDPAVPAGRRTLTQAEAISILRNWTAGDLGTIAACAGVVLHRVAEDAELQRWLRARLSDEGSLDEAIDECLRLDDPFLWNRRVAATDFELGDGVIPAGARVFLNWTSANRDPRGFAAAHEFRPKENAPHNLVYGIGPHVCPGRGLATAQLRVTLAALLENTSKLRLAEREPERASAPTGGFDHVWLILE